MDVSLLLLADLYVQQIAYRLSVSFWCMYDVSLSKIEQPKSRARGVPLCWTTQQVIRYCLRYTYY